MTIWPGFSYPLPTLGEGSPLGRGEGSNMMQAFTIEDLIAANAQSEKRYTEFLRVPAMSAGIYVLPAQSTDLQKPHNQDEVYYIVRGRAKFKSGDTETLAVP